MPDLDLDPGDYRERKPRGWRWRLPWSHPEDSKLPLVMLGVCLVALMFIFATREEGSRETLYGVTLLFAAAAGVFFTSVFRD